MTGTNEAVKGAVDDAVSEAVNWAVNWAVTGGHVENGVIYEDSEPPALQDFLRGIRA